MSHEANDSKIKFNKAKISETGSYDQLIIS